MTNGIIEYLTRYLKLLLQMVFMDTLSCELLVRKFKIAHAFAYADGTDPIVIKITSVNIQIHLWRC
jgi:hypothetical protein